MIVQMLYGFWSNSLGLISDSIHMLFDCLALVIGLVAAIISKWPATCRHPFGFAKFEVIAGFINGISLLFVSISIVYEALERLRHPPEMRTDQLLLVSTLGLLVNLVGIFAFEHGHGHGHIHEHNHSHDLSAHNHSGSCPSSQLPAQLKTQLQVVPDTTTPIRSKQKSKVIATIRSFLYLLISFSGCTTLFGVSGPAYSRATKVSAPPKLPTIQEVKQELVSGATTDCTIAKKNEQLVHKVTRTHNVATSAPHKHEHSHNMHGVFLHILADTLGSVGVIVSSLLYQQTGWPGFDPLASIFIAVLIFCSVVPLVRAAADDLIAMFQDKNEKILSAVLHEIGRHESVHSLTDIHFWYTSGEEKVLHGEVTLHILSGTKATTNGIEEAAQAKLTSVLAHCQNVKLKILRSN
ncbi:Uncharacterized transporter C17D4.03c [Taphrina deformans PYCC 5710]|uniref:Zinc transporter n=1 Tax=Taphrina deformans (strain PYCC 5710 / ATCC 11124 / CBS 356.35 / IMI 108563 / JCM 9778 / NBRC 8474) TaxID=1097556 RepID=R4XFR3_TAPDE|nr:Uncharacterized transporter C17D4.03c [Taphrina deformans PYCC 5710]|eukprot:CCG83327.1 Uncharacterized transporter C17D4.03c [Taphrina deformans PYCC 5710]